LQIAVLFAGVLLGGLGPSPAVWAADAGKVVEKDGRYVFVESQDPSLKLIMDRALKNGWITQAEYDKASLQSEERASLLQPSFKAWYDRGFNFSMNDNAFFLKIRFRAQTRYTQRFRNDAWTNSGDSKNFPELLGVFGDYRANRSGTDSASSFSVRRFRLYFQGHLYNPDFKYFIQLRNDSGENAQTPGGLQLYDLYFTQTTLPWLNVQWGQFKVYWSRSQINSTASMQFSDRSLVQDAFTASGLDRRDIGLTIMNDEELYPVNYYFGIFNGAGPGLNRLGQYKSDQPTPNCPGGQTGGFPFPDNTIACPNGAQRNINANTRYNINQLMYSARVMWNVMGRPGYGEGDLVYSETPQMAIGADYAYNPSLNTSTDNAFVGIDLANLYTRQLLAQYGNARYLGWGTLDFSSWSVDYVFKYRGFSLQAEYYFKNITRHSKGVPCMQLNAAGTVCNVTAPGLLGNATGWYVQSGYYLIPRTVELAARYSYWDPDTNSGGDLIKQVDLSLNWFLTKTYDHQIMVTYSNIAMGMGGFAIGRSAPLPAQGTNFPSGTVPLDQNAGALIENLIRVQYQIFF
jgi:hypothetical protein